MKKLYQPLQSAIRRLSGLTIAQRGLIVFGLLGILLALSFGNRALQPSGTLIEPLPAASPAASVQITADGFLPGTLAVAPGTMVTWTNTDSAPHLVASNPHPNHTDHPGLDAGQPIESQGSYSFTFDFLGTYSYHDHLNPTKNGTIIVEEQADGSTDE